MDKETIGVIRDPLYGEVGYTKEDLRLFQTIEFSRLRQVSLSAVPPWIIPTGSFASRAEHSIGAMHLSDIVTQKKEFKDLNNLRFASLAHDIASPPFSHLSESFLVKLYGKNHEQYVSDILDGSQFSKEVTKQGGDIERIIKLINGEDKPISQLLNGSIDLDNIDNSSRYGLSGGILEKRTWDKGVNPYCELAKGFGLENTEIYLKTWSGYLDYWNEVRKKVYQFVYSDDNLSPGMMVWRAIYFAVNKKEIKKDFFRMTDPEAYDHLQYICNDRTEKLMERAKRWQWYENAYDFNSEAISPDAELLFKDQWNRGEVSDRLAKELGVDPMEVTVYFGRNKGFKNLSLPVYDLSGASIDFKSSSKDSWMAKVFVNPGIRVRRGLIKEFMNDQLKIS